MTCRFQRHGLRKELAFPVHAIALIVNLCRISRQTCLVGLGLLEYIFDVGALIDAMTKYRNLVISYNPIEMVPDCAIRSGHAWVNDFGVVETDSLFANRGYAIQSRLQVDGSQYLWLFLQS